MKKILIAISCLTCWALAADPPNWQPITGTQYSMILFARITLEGEYFENTGTNMAAAFGPGGVNDCRGLAGWQPLNPNGFWYFNIVGNVNGEMISFKIYDEQSDLVYDCDQTYIFTDNLTIGSPTQPVLLTVGSSMISGNVTLITTSPPAGDIQEVEISNGIITVNPDQSGYYLLPANPGIYNLTATLSGYNPVSLTAIEVIQNQVTANIDFTLIDWETISGTQYSMVVMCEVHFGDDLIIFDGLNQVGAFGPAGAADCRGVAVWQEANPPYWNGYWYLTIVGNIQNEEIGFQVFESSTAAVYSCLETVNFINNNTLGSPQNPHALHIDINIDQVMNLSVAWNWISFFAHPPDTSIASVFGSLGANAHQVKNQTQSATYFAASQSWVGSLTSITDGEAYLIHMNNAFSGFTLSGEPINLDTPINLTEDWNWVAYYPRTIRNLSNALSSIEPNVIQVKNQSQAANYIIPPGTWVGDLLLMEPNTGYKINMSNVDQLIYGNGEVRAVNRKKESNYSDDPPSWTIITGTENSMVVMAAISLNNLEFDNNGANMTGAFGPSGVTDCRSIGVWQNANPPYYEDGFWYFTVVGNTDGEEISFQVYDETTDAVYTCSETISFLNNETYGDPVNPFLLTAQLTETGNILPAGNLDLHIYPNPFNPSTTISFSLTTEAAENTEISIYNLKGQKVKTLTFPSRSLGMSECAVVWNGDDDAGKAVCSGVYLCKMQAGNSRVIRKMLLLR